MKKSLIIAVVIVALVAGTYFVIKATTGAEAVSYQFGTVTRGNLESTVSATGTLSPVTTVDVGTQVSGTIDSVYVDYNDHVKAGQLLAVLDTVLLKASVIDAQATVQRNEALMEQAQSDYDRQKSLFDRGMISEAEFLPYKVSLKTQQASSLSAGASLQRAQRNLEYAVITSPIDGIVITRGVESGQTVASSFSTPTLFEIAQNLESMEILAEVDESDIGQIKIGQTARFEVPPYADKEFTGTVKQIRLQPTTVSNVVTYIVVVEAPNPDGLLLPGLTATIDFVVDQRNDVLMVPTKALRFQPSEEQLAEFHERMQSRRAEQAGAGRQESADSTGQRATRPQGMGNGSSTRPKDAGMVWYVDSLGQLNSAPVRTGMTDGSNTEILSSPRLTESMPVIVATGSASTEKSGQANTGMRMGPPPGF